MDKSKRVCIIPAFNEERTIGTVIAGLLPYCDVIVVDDRSSDRTSALAMAAGADVVKHERNGGYEEALNSGFKRAVEQGYLYALTFDADGQHDSRVVNSFFEPLENNTADLVCGVRPKYARIGEWLMGIFFSVLYKVKDPLCGMKSYRLEYYSRVGFFDRKKLVGAELLVHFFRMGARIKQIPIPIFAREDESRFGGSWRANKRIMKALGRSFKV